MFKIAMCGTMTDQTKNHLALAERHIVEGEQRIADPKALIEQLARGGHNTTDANNLLNVLQDSLTLMRRHRKLIVDEIAGKTGNTIRLSHD